MAHQHKFTVFTGSSGGKIITRTTERKVSDYEVLVRITHSGLCGTDCHYKGAEMGLGHEGVGIVEAIGAKVKRFKVGERTGWGYIQGTCGNCMQCLEGNDSYCESREMYGSHNLDQGSLATYGVWQEKFLFTIPENMTSEAAAPLMCGGATVFGALYDFDVRSSQTVGVVGIGGLGHLAIQFAAKMGCRVAVFSSTESKREEAMKLGATEFYATKGVTELTVQHKVDFLLVTTASQPDWSLLISTMAIGGSIIPLTVSFDNLVIPYMPLLLAGLKIVGVIVPRRSTHNRMLDFAARHNINPIIQEFPMTIEGIEEAFETMENGSLRYRAVLKN